MGRGHSMKTINSYVYSDRKGHPNNLAEMYIRERGSKVLSRVLL